MIVIIKLECCSTHTSHWSSSWCVAVFTSKRLVIYSDYNRDMRTDSSHFQEISHPVAELHNENEARGTNLYAERRAFSTYFTDKMFMATKKSKTLCNPNWSSSCLYLGGRLFFFPDLESENKETTVCDVIKCHFSYPRGVRVLSSSSQRDFLSSIFYVRILRQQWNKSPFLVETNILAWNQN